AWARPRSSTRSPGLGGAEAADAESPSTPRTTRKTRTPPEVLGPIPNGGCDRDRRTVRSMPTGIVTGASRGLGLALGRALVERGWRLVVDARGAAALEGAWAGTADVDVLAGDIADDSH